MEKLVVSAVTGALGPVLGYLAALLGEEYKLVKGVRGKIMFLQAELDAMHAFLLKMSRVEQPDEQAKCWMKDVRELSYDIHNSIEDFMLRVGDGKSAKPKGVKGFIKRSMDLMTKTKTRRRIGKEVQSLETLVKEVAERRARYKIDDNVSKASNAAVDPRVCAMYMDLSELVGIQGPTEEIVKLLNGGAADAPAQQLKVVSIVGPGGLGKTTLARHVYDTLGKKFQYRAFVSVSRNPNVVTILRSILMQVGYHKALLEDAQCLIDAISNFLEDKRYFIVVDDVWSVESWNIIKCAFSRSSCSSRIITTTRVSEVAKSCISYGGDVYNLRPLNIVDSEWLFLQRIFGSAQQCPLYLKRVSDKILQKCGGLPLAIIAISGLLATNREEGQWEQVQKSIGHGLGSNPGVEGMMRILSFSYFDLNPCLKSCLLYLSIFSEDADILKKDLVRRWVREGFIPEENGHTRYELGERCFNELINRSLIQPTKRNEFGEVMIVRVHDSILDFVIAKSKEENFVTLLGVLGVNPDPQIKARRLSLQSGSEIPTGLDLSNAWSLVCFGGSFTMPYLQIFKNLRVLEFENCMQLKDHHVADIGKFCHLKHLRFQNTGIKKFPEQIVELHLLETLEIVELRGQEKRFVIPSTICQLQRLTHLVVPQDTILPDETGSMQALQVLEGINVIRHSTIFCQQLGQLTNLRKLGIKFREDDVSDNIEENIKEMVSSICKLGKANLRILYVLGWHTIKILYRFDADDFLDESSLSALRGLRGLYLRCHAVTRRIPRSMSLLANLQILSLRIAVINEEGMEILGGLPALGKLMLDVAEDGREGGKIRISSVYGFLSLINFRIGSHGYMPRLIFEAGSMPKLQTLYFYCTWTDQLDFGIQHLSSLTLIRCGSALSETTQKLKAAIEAAIQVHPNHPTFQWL